METKRIEVHGSLTLLQGDSFYTVDNDVFYFNENETYEVGYYVIYQKSIYKVIKKSKGNLPTDPTYFTPLKPSDKVSNYATDDDVRNLKEQIGTSGDGGLSEVIERLTHVEDNYVQSVNGIKPTEGNVVIPLGEDGSIDLTDYVKMIDVGGTKTIQLNNSQPLSALDTAGTNQNLIHISNQDVVEVGTVNKNLNLNGTQVKVNNNEVAIKTDLDSLATKDELTEYLRNDDVNVVKLNDGNIELKNNKGLKIQSNDGVSKDVVKISDLDVVEYGNTELQTNILTKDKLLSNGKEVALIEDTKQRVFNLNRSLMFFINQASGSDTDPENPYYDGANITGSKEKPFKSFFHAVKVLSKFYDLGYCAVTIYIDGDYGDNPNDGGDDIILGDLQGTFSNSSINIENMKKANVRFKRTVVQGGTWSFQDVTFENGTKNLPALEVTDKGIVVLYGSNVNLTSAIAETDAIKVHSGGSIFLSPIAQIEVKNSSSTKCRSAISSICGGNFYGNRIFANSNGGSNSITIKGEFTNVFYLDYASKACFLNTTNIVSQATIKKYDVKGASILQGATINEGLEGTKDGTSIVG